VSALSVVVAVLLVAATSHATRGPQVNTSETTQSSASTWQAGDPVMEPPAKVPGILGVNYHPLWEGMTQDKRGQVLDQVSGAGVSWVRIDIGWHDIQPVGPGSYDVDGRVRQIDQRIAEARERGLHVLLLFYWAPEWASGTKEKNGRPRDPQQYAAAAAWVAERYSGRADESLRVDAIELWNEPDLERFWAAHPRATQISDFAELIRLAGAAVKGVGAHQTVVVGGLSALEPAWLEDFYAADPGMGSSYDVLGLHAYPSPGDSPPDHFDLSYPQYSMLTLRSMSQVMDAWGDPAPIWVTEFGWSTHANTPFVTDPWERGVNEGAQADYLLGAMRVLTAQPRVEAAFWYNAWSPPLSDEHMDGFGLVASDFRRKPAYFAMRCAAAGVCGPTVETPR
jgi:hypothetical protein